MTLVRPRWRRRQCEVYFQDRLDAAGGFPGPLPAGHTDLSKRARSSSLTVDRYTPLGHVRVLPSYDFATPLGNRLNLQTASSSPSSMMALRDGSGSGGCAAYLRKPFPPQVLFDAVANAMSGFLIGRKSCCRSFGIRQFHAFVTGRGTKLPEKRDCFPKAQWLFDQLHRNLTLGKAGRVAIAT
jgi:hypothetical protein